MGPSVVADSSCLIGLESIDQLDLLTRVFPETVAPPAVEHEFGDAPDWLGIEPVPNRSLAQRLSTQLDEGESEAIALAVARGLPVVLDDLAARRTAQEMDLRVIGTLGVILRAKRRGFIPACKPLIDGLLEADFRISETLYRRVLQLAGE